MFMSGWRVNCPAVAPASLRQPQLIARLRGLGLETRGTRRRTITPPPDHRHARTAIRREIECPQVATAWERVYRLLRDAFPPAHYHRGKGCRSSSQDRRKVSRRIFPMAKAWKADLLIGADGIRSTVRQQLSTRRDAALRRLCAPGERLIPEAALSAGDASRSCSASCRSACRRANSFSVIRSAGPDNDLRPGNRRTNVIWYRPADEEDQAAGPADRCAGQARTRSPSRRR